MELSKFDRTTFKRNKTTHIELIEIFSRVNKSRDYLSEIDAIHSKKILALVANNPKLGHKKLSDSLMLEGITIDPYFIYLFLVKHNLNRKSLRMAWKNSLEES